MSPSDDPNLTPADESMGISEIAVILMSLGMAPANFKVAEHFYRNRFGDAAVDIGFESAGATGWNMDDEEQIRAFSTLVEQTQADKLSEVSHKNLVEQCVTPQV